MQPMIPVWLRAVVFVLLVPGIAAGCIPWRLAHQGGTPLSAAPPAHWLGLLPLGLGWNGLLYCVRDFVRRGRGTPSPFDAPRTLVAGGLYRVVRNPMYVSVLLAVVGQGIWFWSPDILRYALLLALAFHLVVVLYEERTLARRFGDSYALYRTNVPRWIPRLPWRR
jgi:protein-S-isoprenylcysteine O-methyltransferase Ste14